MSTAVLEGERHGHEHFVFDDLPQRILVQTKESSGMYGRNRNVISIYQDADRLESGCHVFSFVRSKAGIIDGLVEVQ